MRIVLVGRDLRDRDRLWRGTEHLTARVVAGTGPDRLVAFLAENQPTDVLVLDLDAGGDEVLEALAAARDQGLLPERVLGYFSHVREEIGTAARAAGVETYPRGRFWRDIASLMEPEGKATADGE